MSRIRTTAQRRAWLPFALFGASLLVSLPAFAAGPACSAGDFNGLQVQANNQNLVEFDVANGYAPVTVTLRANKQLPTGGSYAWTQVNPANSTQPPVAGTAVTLNTSDQVHPSFQTRDFGPNGVTLGFKVVASCNGTAVANATGTVTILNVDRPPTVVASASPPIVYEGDAVVLSASASDPDGDAISYAWTQTDGATMTLSAPTSAQTGFTVPLSGNTSGYTLQFKVVATSRSLSASYPVVVNVSYRNLPPHASLSCPDSVDEGAPLQLDGSGSYDPEAGPLSYAWSQTQAPPDINVDAETGAVVQRNAPLLGLGQDGFVGFELRVTDDHGQFQVAQCMTQIRDATAPVLSLPAPEVLDAASAAGTSKASYAVSAMDNVEGDIGAASITCDPPAPHLFPLGETAVHCSVTDTAGNTGSGSFSVTVQDLDNPILQPHDDVAVEATSAAGAIATFDLPLVSDAVDTTLVPTCTPPSGSQFPLGSTPVQCGATDQAGNPASPIGFNVTVHDTTAPVVTPPADVAVEATGPLNTVVYGTATATDAVGVASITSDAPVSFPVDVTTIRWTATDATGNAGHADSKVTVTDHTAPMIDAQVPIPDTEATSAAGAAVSYISPATHDLVDGPGTADCAPVSGSTFALGTTIVTCTASDAHHNPATPTTFDVTVVDTTPPAIDLHASVTAEATGPDGADVTYTSPATHDAVDGNGTATCTPASGSTFALGTKSVACTATDAHKNTSHSSFNITVADTTPPKIDAHAAITKIEATGPAGAVVVYDTPLTHDLVDGDGVASCLPASGATFAVGTATVLCNAQDQATNAATQTSFTVQVVDTTAPVIQTHGDVGPIEATSAGGAIASYVAPTWTDAVDVSGSASCSPLSGTQFKLGQTTVACAAVDHAGNAATITYFKVTVRDHTAPVIATHGNQSVEATSAAGAAVTYTSPATSDAVDGPGSASCLPASGSTFPLGSNTVTCNARDAADNDSTPTTFTITVVDTTAPAIAPHADVTATATGNSSAVVTYTLPIATDLVDGNDAVSCLPASGANFNVGVTAVNCGSTDHAGNHSTSSFNVIVSYGFSGFYRPVDNLPTVNVVKAGSAIPVKFSLGGDQGLNIFASGYPASVSTACNAASTDAIEETVTAGGSSLTYDAASGQYIYVWKTEKSWTGCRQLQVKLRDGSSRWAAFSFTR